MIEETFESLLLDGYWITVIGTPEFHDEKNNIHEYKKFTAFADTPPRPKDGLQSLVASGKGGSVNEALQDLVLKLNELAKGKIT